MADNRCVMCLRSRIMRSRRHVLADDLPVSRPQLAEYVQQNALIEVVFNNTQNVCHRCWQRINAVQDQQPAENVQDDVVPDHGPEPEAQNMQPFIHVPEYVRAPNSARRCIFNHCNNVERNRIPEAFKVIVLCSQRLYIPENARVCTEHLESNEWQSLRDNCNVLHDFNVTFFTDMSNILISAVTRGSRLDFEIRELINPNDLFFWTGLTIAQFNTVLEETPSLTQAVNRTRTVIGVYLSKLRTGESNERLATLFNMSRRTLERKLALAREHLMTDFVAIHLGMDNISRHNILERNLFLPKMIFGNEENTKAIMICDGTYIYIEKSTNFLFQRLTYSHHKFQNLLKPFLIVCSDGFIIDVLGPYAATTSDATIMTSLCTDEDNPFHWMFHQYDVFILDRGFRDSIEYLESLGYEPHMPPTKDRNENQLTTEQANKARLVTICRWVVEAVNGKFKNRFKLLRQDYFNRALPHMFVDFKIAASLINAFYRVATDQRLCNEIWSIISEKINSPNLLFDYVTLKNLNRQRVAFIRMEADLPHLEDFPQLTEDDIILISLGSYQIKLAKSYASENLRDGGVYTIEIYRENNLNDLGQCNIHQTNVWLLRGRVQSRHVRSRTYYTYILIDRDQIGRDAIIQYYCTCLTGRRTVGSCAHVISIIWYLGLGRHGDGFNRPAIHLDDIIVDAQFI